MSGKSAMCPPYNVSTVSYTRPLLEIEKNFDTCVAFTWLRENWTLCYYFMGAYLMVIFVGREFMKSRLPFQLRGVLLLWNVVLAVFSICISWRMIPTMFYTLQLHGFFGSFCNMGQSEQIQAVGLWLFLAAFSKLAEFGDTVFIVLRKTPLTFLHWYHHLSVAFYTWSSARYPSPMHNYFLVINLFVHSIMYSYYALKVIGIRVPKAVNVAITSLQVLQMVAGMLITWYAHHRKSADQNCKVNEQDIAVAASMYLSYLLLFLNFFNKSYIVGRKQPATNDGNSKKVS